MSETYRWLEPVKSLIFGNVCPKNIRHEMRTKPKDAAFGVHDFTPGLEFTIVVGGDEQDPSTIWATNALHPSFNSTFVDELDLLLSRGRLTRSGRLALVSRRSGLR